jgi:xanthine dehydrogenase accessory factor
MRQVVRWLAEGRPVTVARVVDTRGISSRDRAATVAWSPGQPLAGQLFDGAANEQLPALLGSSLGLVEFRITEDDAARAGLACGGTAQLYVQPAETIPAEAWTALANERPVALVTEIATGTTWIGESRTGVSLTELRGDQLLTAYWPTPRILIVGGGTIAQALTANAALLGWHCSVVTVLAELSAADNVVVLEHDLDISGAALITALASDVGYLGALGSRHTQARRAEWLLEHGVTDLSAIHGPAGLDIGSRTPAEIALSILAEIVSVRR